MVNFWGDFSEKFWRFPESSLGHSKNSCKISMKKCVQKPLQKAMQKNWAKNHAKIRAENPYKKSVQKIRTKNPYKKSVQRIRTKNPCKKSVQKIRAKQIHAKEIAHSNPANWENPKFYNKNELCCSSASWLPQVIDVGAWSRFRISLRYLHHWVALGKFNGRCSRFHVALRNVRAACRIAAVLFCLAKMVTIRPKLLSLHSKIRSEACRYRIIRNKR